MSTNPTSNQCVWTRLPDILHPLELAKVQMMRGCDNRVACGPHAIHPDDCPSCGKRVLVRQAHETSACLINLDPGCIRQIANNLEEADEEELLEGAVCEAAVKALRDIADDAERASEKTSRKPGYMGDINGPGLDPDVP